MKFGKELSSQMVQEWKEVYMDYNYLKTILKDISSFRRTLPVPVTPKSSLRKRVSLYRAFSGLTTRYSNVPKVPLAAEQEDEAILFSATEDEGHEGNYQTMFLMSSEEGGDKELMYFTKLDSEFNKVVKFYASKVEEVLKEAEVLNKQMDVLIALRIRVDNPMMVTADTSSPSISPLIDKRKPVLGVIHEIEMSNEGDNHRMPTADYTPASVDILDHVKVNVEAETPALTFHNLLRCSHAGFVFSKEELRKVEELMRKAFTEFYQKLLLLKSYCFLNQLAFSKIMKKYDKITTRKASKAYMEMVDKSYLCRSDEINKLVERVEATVTKHFFNGNRRKGMNSLRKPSKREKHRITFFLGLLAGCSLALIVAVVLIVHGMNFMQSSREARDQYMENIFPLYSLFGFIILHLIMLAANIYFWRRFRVNYAFIFELEQGSELGYREVLLISSGLSVLTLAAVISNLELEMDPRTQSFQAITELVPLGLVIVVLVVLFCPFNIMYRTNRFFLISCAWHCLCAPLYKVTLLDFFLADQLTSQVQAFRSLEFYVCYYGWGDFKRRSNTCQDSDIYRIFYLIVAIIPYWSRFLQCMRRLFGDKDWMHALNGLKYMSIIVAISMRTIHEIVTREIVQRNSTNMGLSGFSWQIIAGSTSIFATILATYWDIVMDWGLLRKSSTNPWLRDKLLVPSRSVYFVAIVSNILLRLAWMQTVMGIRDAPFVHRRALTAFVACLEILRRGIWNFFRLENEHLNNVGKYRAFKSVPLPFSFQG
jgi:hypothetical protein